jgi:wobble nucleotide-excising tRNase
VATQRVAPSERKGLYIEDLDEIAVLCGLSYIKKTNDIKFIIVLIYERFFRSDFMLEYQECREHKCRREVFRYEEDFNFNNSHIHGVGICWLCW